MSELPEDRYISDRTIYGNGYDPEKIVEELKVQARKLVAEVYDEFYSPGYLKRILSGHLDYDHEVELAVKAILTERERCRNEIEAYARSHGARHEHDEDGLTVELTCQEIDKLIRGED
jgi:hypothetical protein